MSTKLVGSIAEVGISENFQCNIRPITPSPTGSHKTTLQRYKLRKGLLCVRSGEGVAGYRLIIQLQSLNFPLRPSSSLYEQSLRQSFLPLCCFSDHRCGLVAPTQPQLVFLFAWYTILLVTSSPSYKLSLLRSVACRLLASLYLVLFVFSVISCSVN